MTREFKHALTGRSLVVTEGSRTERLVEADANWSELKPKSTSKKEASDGSGNAGGRGGTARKGTQRRGSRKGSESA